MTSDRFEELNRQAEKCFTLAREAPDSQTRLHFLNMARFWAQKAHDAMVGQDESVAA
jgi:hypothetical protein